MVSRRTVLQAAAGVPLLAGCSVSGTSGATVANHSPSGVPLRRVQVADERVIRTVAGLRPFRRQGFRVEAEPMDDKLVIHNYGHGGGGITLSWGSSHLATEFALQTNHRRCAVLGSGVMGLTTARLMQDRGWDVTIYTRDLPPDTTSNIAGGQWSPTSVYEEEFVTPAFRSQFERAMAYAYRYYQNLVGPRYGVRWIGNYQIASGPPAENDFNTQYADFYPQLQEMSADSHPFPAQYVRYFDTMLIEPATFLLALVEDFHAAGGTLNVREFSEEAELLTLEEPVIFNCTGLGSSPLFNDSDMQPIRGQLSFLLPQEEVDYIILGNGGLYMFPRSDGILLGGTFEYDQWLAEPDPAATRRILDGHRNFFSAMNDPWSN
ncbi:MAG: FAD-binding oxidoreductase [Gammaproteobacteria bacterium]|nr:FAD-binding oxidoreductase [Gammaproteobacteria bacterium]